MYQHALTVFCAFLIAGLANAQAATYNIDPAHSSVNFKIRHLVSKTRGKFDKFTGTFEYHKDKLADSKLMGTVETASINTDNQKRDEHLRSDDFFAAKKFPKIEFVSTKFTDQKDGKATIEGNITIKGVTKPITLAAEIGGEAKDPWGNQVVGFSATGKLNRKDFGIVWNKTLDAGGLMLGEDVEIALEFEGGAAKTDAPKKK
ncbi:MAG: YceI family protein [Bacteriovoracia bacterium]